jgi:hypothetical protein
VSSILNDSSPSLLVTRLMRFLVVEIGTRYVILVYLNSNSDVLLVFPLTARGNISMVQRSNNMTDSSRIV